MKALLLLLSIPLWAQQQTPNLGLNLPAPNQTGWNQLINQNFSTLDSYLGGTLAIPSIKVTNPGVFTNTQMNLYFQSLLNGCNPQTEFQLGQGPNNSTDAISGCVLVPPSATAHQENAVAGYADTSAVGGSGGAVGGYFFGHGTANNTSFFGVNSIVVDTPSIGSGVQMISDEADVDIQGTPARVWGILVSGASSGTVPALGSAAGIEIRGPGYANGNTLPWPAALNLPDDAGILGINVGTLHAGNSQASMPIQLQGRDGGGVIHNAQIQATLAGNVVISTPVQQLQMADSGTCTMAAGTCSAQSLSTTYAGAPKCVATWTGTGTLSGPIKIASITTTVTPSSATGTDTAQVNWVCFGH